MRIATALCVAGCLLMSLPVAAHHGVGTYDSTKSVTLSGVVTEFAVRQSARSALLRREGRGGKVVNWAIEMNSPGVLRRAGWTKATFKPGDQITITVRPAKAGTPVGLINRAQAGHRQRQAVLSGDRTANAID